MHLGTLLRDRGLSHGPQSSHRTYIYGVDGKNLVGYFTDADNVRYGFLYNGTSLSIIDIPGITGVWGIEGNNLVGSYYDAYGSHGFIYTIPGPTTLLLLGMGSLVVRRRRTGRARKTLIFY